MRKGEGERVDMISETAKKKIKTRIINPIKSTILLLSSHLISSHFISYISYI